MRSFVLFGWGILLLFYFLVKIVCLKEEGKIIDTDYHNGADSMSAIDSDCLFKNPHVSVLWNIVS